jgi:hypothetical protein
VPKKPESVPVAPQTEVEPRRKLWQALFFTKDGRLDLGWLLLAVSCLIGLGVFGGQAIGLIPTDRPSKEAWAWFGAFIVLAFIGGAARDRAALIAKGNVIGAITQVVGSSESKGGSGVD